MLQLLREQNQKQYQLIQDLHSVIKSKDSDLKELREIVDSMRESYEYDKGSLPGAKGSSPRSIQRKQNRKSPLFESDRNPMQDPAFGGDYISERQSLSLAGPAQASAPKPRNFIQRNKQLAAKQKKGKFQ